MPAETRKLVKLWSDARLRGEECALATVVRVAGSSYRKPGARMLLTRSGQRVGTVSGGCLEGEVSRKIWWLTEQGPTVQDYSTSYDDDSQQSYGLGCDGVVTLLLERAAQANQVFEALQKGSPGTSSVGNRDRHRRRRSTHPRQAARTRRRYATQKYKWSSGRLRAIDVAHRPRNPAFPAIRI